jgi:hypothetical protein
MDKMDILIVDFIYNFLLIVLKILLRAKRKDDGRKVKLANKVGRFFFFIKKVFIKLEMRAVLRSLR